MDIKTGHGNEIEILDHLMEGCQIIGKDYTYIYANDIVLKHGRTTWEALKGNRMMDVYPGIETTQMFKNIEKCMNERIPVRMVNHFNYPDGSDGWFELSMEPVPEGVFILSNDITGRMQVQEALENQLEHLKALRKIDLTILGNTDFHSVLESVLDVVVQHLDVDAVEIMMYNETFDYFQHELSKGFLETDNKENALLAESSLLGCVFRERKPYYYFTVSKDVNDPLFMKRLEGEALNSFYVVPLIAKRYVNAVLIVYLKEQEKKDKEWLDFLEILTGQASMAIENLKLYDRMFKKQKALKRAYDATIAGWSKALDLKDEETEEHTLRVTEKTLALAKHFDFNEDELLCMKYGSLLHDIGKIGIPDSILLKPGGLTDEELATMRKHPTYAFELLSPIPHLKCALDIPYSHHEKWNGTGYPRGLKGEQIPLAARIFAVVDVWDALLSDRPYRKGWSEEKVLQYLKEQSGKHFDPKVVETFLEWLA